MSLRKTRSARRASRLSRASVHDSLASVDDSGRAELVDNRPKPFLPERRLRWHLHHHILCERVEYAVGVGDVIEIHAATQNPAGVVNCPRGASVADSWGSLSLFAVGVTA
jgi:hypothetical protein